ncbi:hypothetical protein EPA93_12575 [Ktedonosporobacter rubrisoli]|uniref:Glycoside-hydrolase family GH114 TIM-barrel domain-containing protein n=1 Tax=Ktedonosporobacter rubrisoli TaxID=2509675 RepID=A0A4P6JNP2_KTERU|nr:endo alpha-1,4 polygalactosaminidase [Ktedonosporobacter rubrisoli]QBD76793.1 hypothetical protein EPA93_12575 [Ktedonosporobacter rubrisoli]
MLHTIIRHRVFLSFVGLLFILCAVVIPSTIHAQTASGINKSNTTSNLSHKLTSLAQVKNWLYFISKEPTQEDLTKIESSSYDMVVIDNLHSLKGSSDYPLRNMLQRWHSAAHPKLALAYIDIGEAESYRTYWQEGWKVGNPSWIVGKDPDGWDGSFPVAFWHQDWQKIWLDKQKGYLQDILNAGFDGIYLDWVQAYQDKSVTEAAKKQGKDPQKEMANWVRTLANFARAQKQDFLVIGQNVPELALDEKIYFDTIDALAQEQTWFDGGVNNMPPGGCPLPQTDADVDSTSYYNSLSDACKAAYKANPDGSLHESTASHLKNWEALHNQGKPIFTVDYAEKPENIDKVYRVSRSLGFVPLVTTRNLDKYVPPHI